MRFTRSSSSEKPPNTYLNTAEFSVLHNGRFLDLLSVEVPHTSHYFSSRNATLGNNGKIYYVELDRVYELDPDTGEKTFVYSDPQSYHLAALSASEHENKIYILQSFHELTDGGLGDQALIEYDIDSGHREFIYRFRGSLYTGLRFISSTRRGDVLFCVCGGEGGGVWRTFYLKGRDGSVEQVSIEEIMQTYLDVDEVHFTFFGEKTSIGYEGYLYEKDSLILSHRDGNEFSIFLLNVFTKEVEELYSFEDDVENNDFNKLQIVISPKQQRLFVYMPHRAFMLSLPEGTVIQEQTFEHPMSHLGVYYFLTEEGSSFFGSHRGQTAIVRLTETGMETGSFVSKYRPSSYKRLGHIDDESILYVRSIDGNRAEIDYDPSTIFLDMYTLPEVPADGMRGIITKRTVWVRPLQGSFECNNGNKLIAINGREYCETKFDEDSSYKKYHYSTLVDNAVYNMSFSLYYKACTTEQECMKRQMHSENFDPLAYAQKLLLVVLD